ncbi:hypothetical protein AB0K51_09830 [Kitasatospora sp. NPDC049285]|uniref:hypothetical protein n=1 Tax=Kitasatospora sp. NPDC049285 TaxID=3157096 RepID=UPI003427741A
MTTTDRTDRTDHSGRHAPSTSMFEQRLAEELAALATERARTARAAAHGPLFRWQAAGPHRRPLLTGRRIAAVFAVAAAATTAVVLPSALGGAHGGAAAYAVTRGPGGTIALELRDPAGLPGMVAELQRYGVRAAGIEAAENEAQCPLPQPAGPPARANLELPGDTRTTVRIDPALIPPGATLLLITTPARPGAGAAVSAFTTRVVDAVPACVPPMVRVERVGASSGEVPTPTAS